MAQDYNVQMKQFNGTDFDNIYPKVKTEGIVDIKNNYFTKNETLTSSTASSLGISSNPIPDQAFKALINKTVNLPNARWTRIGYVASLAGLSKGDTLTISLSKSLQSISELMIVSYGLRDNGQYSGNGNIYVSQNGTMQDNANNEYFIPLAYYLKSDYQPYGILVDGAIHYSPIKYKDISPTIDMNVDFSGVYPVCNNSEYMNVGRLKIGSLTTKLTAHVYLSSDSQLTAGTIEILGRGEV